MIIKLLTEHHLEFLCLTEGCIGSPESTLVKMSHCWKSHALAQITLYIEYDKTRTPLIKCKLYNGNYFLTHTHAINPRITLCGGNRFQSCI